MGKKVKVSMDHIGRLSRGQRSGAKIGSRAVGHRLRGYERDIYERSLKKGYLEIEEGSRSNLENIWKKTCEVKGWGFIVLIKKQGGVEGEVLKDEQLIFSGPLKEAKAEAKRLWGRESGSSL